MGAKINSVASTNYQKIVANLSREISKEIRDEYRVQSGAYYSQDDLFAGDVVKGYEDTVGLSKKKLLEKIDKLNSESNRRIKRSPDKAAEQAGYVISSIIGDKQTIKNDDLKLALLELALQNTTYGPAIKHVIMSEPVKELIIELEKTIESNPVILQNIARERDEKYSPERKINVVKIIFSDNKDGGKEMRGKFKEIVQSGNKNEMMNVVHRIYEEGNGLEDGKARVSDYVLTDRIKPPQNDKQSNNDPYVGKSCCEFLPDGAEGKALAINSKEEFKSFLNNVIEKFGKGEYIIDVAGHITDIIPALGNLHDAMKEVMDETLHKKFGMVLFESCAMNRVPVAEELSDVAKIMVASEELFILKKWDFSWLLENIGERYSGKFEELIEISKYIVNNSGESQMSAIDLEKMESDNNVQEKKEGFESCLTKLGEQILNIKDKESLEKLKEIISNSKHFIQEFIGDNSLGLVDVYDFAEKIMTDPYFAKNSPEFISTAEALLKTKDEYVIMNANDGIGKSGLLDYYIDVDNAKGISIDIPGDNYKPMEEIIMNNSKLYKNTGWDKVIKYLTEEFK
jgi:hypothetical protein